MNHDPAFSLDEALARVDDDRETFQMMVELFLEHVRRTWRMLTRPWRPGTRPPWRALVTS